MTTCACATTSNWVLTNAASTFIATDTTVATSTCVAVSVTTSSKCSS